MWAKILLCSLQCYFLLMALTVERSYCFSELSPDHPGLLMKEAYEFSVVNNRLFLERPEWMRVATCVSSSTFSVFYCAILVTCLMDAWHVRWVQNLLLMFHGAKIYALGFYHLMNFWSHVPPENLIPYWSTEGPYLVSMGMVLFNIWNASPETSSKPKQN